MIFKKFADQDWTLKSFTVPSFLLGQKALVEKRLLHNSNVQMCYTTLSSVLYILHICVDLSAVLAEDSKVCTMHTGAPRFRYANHLSFRCDGWQVSQRCRGSLTSTNIADVNPGCVLWLINSNPQENLVLKNAFAPKA